MIFLITWFSSAEPSYNKPFLNTFQSISVFKEDKWTSFSNENLECHRFSLSKPQIQSRILHRLTGGALKPPMNA